MKAIHIADTHIRLGDRWDECKWVLNHIAQRVEEIEPAVVLHAGDVFDRESKPEEMRFAERWFQRMANVCDVVIVRGNHDAEHEIEGFSRLAATHRIHALERPNVIEVGPLAIACVPWPTMGTVAAQAEDLGSAGLVGRDALRVVLRSLGMEMINYCDKPRIAIMHCMRGGAKTSSDQPLRGCDFELNDEDLELLNCNAYLLGHIHRSQTFSPPKHRDWIMRYGGSPFHTDFGDWREKSFTILEYDSRRVIGYSTEDTAAHQMVNVVANWVSDDGFEPQLCFDGSTVPNDPKDCELKLTYTFSAQHANAAHAAAKAWRAEQAIAGAYSVRLNPEAVVTTRARAPEVATAVAPIDKLRAYIRSIGEAPEDAAHQREIAKFSHLTGQS
jgi:exonuclease SbcD